MLKGSKNATPLSEFIAKQIARLQGVRTQAEISADAGFNSVNMISMLASGKVKLPLDRVLPLAAALRCDPAKLVRLALQESVPFEVLQVALKDSEQTKNWATAVAVATQTVMAEAELAQLGKMLASIKARAGKLETRMHDLTESLGRLADETREPSAGE